MGIDEVEDDDLPVLSGDTLALLQSFYTDRDSSLSRFANLKSGSATHVEQVLSMDMFSEDWNASQFWYNDETATVLARQLLAGATAETCIAVVSTPSVFIQLKNLLMGVEIHPKICLLEYDERFGVFQEFVRYDFEKPTQLRAELKGAFDRILIDPPYHSRDCQIQFAKTVAWLAPPASKMAQIIVCTGESMEVVVLQQYLGMHATDFGINHNQGRLKSEYMCFANFECEAWSYRPANSFDGV